MKLLYVAGIASLASFASLIVGAVFAEYHTVKRLEVVVLVAAAIFVLALFRPSQAKR